MAVPLLHAVQHRDVGSTIGMIASGSRTFLSAHPRLALTVRRFPRKCDQPLLNQSTSMIQPRVLRLPVRNSNRAA